MEKVLKKSELRIEARNEVGIMAGIAALMAESGVNIDNFCAYNSHEKSIINLLTSDNVKARKALEGKGYKIEEREVVVLHLWNRPGALSAVAGKIRDSGINLESVYGTSTPGGERTAIVFLSEDNARVSEIFDDMVVAAADQTA